MKKQMIRQYGTADAVYVTHSKHCNVLAWMQWWDDPPTVDAEL